MKQKETETFGLLTDNAVNHLLCASTYNLLAGYFKNRISNKCWERRAQRHENEEQKKSTDMTKRLFSHISNSVLCVCLLYFSIIAFGINIVGVKILSFEMSEMKMTHTCIEKCTFSIAMQWNFV